MFAYKSELHSASLAKARTISRNEHCYVALSVNLLVEKRSTAERIHTVSAASNLFYSQDSEYGPAMPAKARSAGLREHILKALDDVRSRCRGKSDAVEGKLGCRPPRRQRSHIQFPAWTPYAWTSYFKKAQGQMNACPQSVGCKRAYRYHDASPRLLMTRTSHTSKSV